MNEPATVSGWERSMAAAEMVRDRLLRATAALNAHGVPYAIAGEIAVAEWVGRVDPAAVRTAQYVDILLNRGDLEAAKGALESVGIDVFPGGPDEKARDGVRVAFAGEKVREEYLLPNPGLSEAEAASGFRVLSLEALARIKLTSFRRGDRVDLRDLIDVDLIDATWPAKFPPELEARLQELLDTPDG